MATQRLGASIVIRACSTFSNTARIGSHHKVSGFDRYLLVLARKYPNLGEVPFYVSVESMEKARNRGRIVLNVSLAAIAAVGCFFMAMSGKLIHAKGGSVQQLNHNWHENYNETHKN